MRDPFENCAESDHIGCGHEGNLLCRVCLHPLPGHLFYYPERNRTLAHPSCVGLRIDLGFAALNDAGATFLIESTSVPLVIADLYIPKGYPGRYGCARCEPPPVGSLVILPDHLCQPHRNERLNLLSGERSMYFQTIAQDIAERRRPALDQLAEND